MSMYVRVCVCCSFRPTCAEHIRRVHFSIRAKLNVLNENCLDDATDEDKIVMERTISSTC